MPQAFTDLDLSLILKELRGRNYGIDSCRGYAFRLTTRSKTDIVKSTGLGRWVPIGGVTPQQIAEIRRTSRDARQAANRVEDLATGKVQEVGEGERSSGNGAVDMGTLGKLIDNKIDAKMAGMQGSLDAIIAALGVKKPAPPPLLEIPPKPSDEFLEDNPKMNAPLVQAAPPPEKRRPGRPRKHPLPQA